MIGQISEMWPHGPHRSSWGCFNSIPHGGGGGGGGCCATIYSYSIRMVREAEKWQSFRSMVRNGAGVLTHKVVFMRRDQLRMALGWQCPKLLLFIRETISSQEVRISHELRAEAISQWCYSWISWASVVTGDPGLCKIQHDTIAMFKIFPPHPRIPFPHLPGLTIKRRGTWLQTPEGHKWQWGPVSADEPTLHHLLCIMKVPMAALAVLLCTMALWSEVFSAPCESTPLQQVSTPLQQVSHTLWSWADHSSFFFFLWLQSLQEKNKLTFLFKIFMFLSVGWRCLTFCRYPGLGVTVSENSW